MPSTCSCCALGRHPQPGRRAMLAGLGALAALPMASPVRRAMAAEAVPKTSLTSDQALDLMKKGNDEFVAGAPQRALLGRERRLELAHGQAPFCILVGCSDSRVPPELLFNRGLGEIFIVRNAGNTVDTAAMGSVEYGVGVLGCPLVIVLGHESCGAVAAAIDVVQKNASFPGVIGEMVQPIIPAALAARDEKGEMTLNAAVHENARRVAKRLKTQSVVVQQAVAQGRLRVVAAYYRLADGDVEWFEEI